jgi:uncharacterized protein YcaQ
MTLDDVRRFAVARSLFPPTTLKRALHKLGFVQADPIRAPARAQDLILRHRVTGYRAGDQLPAGGSWRVAARFWLVEWTTPRSSSRKLRVPVLPNSRGRAAIV